MPPISPSYIVQLLFNGLVNGSIYVLIALGLTLMFGVFEVPNFAHGQTYMFGAYFAWVFSSETGLSFWSALAIAILLTAVIGVAMDRLAYAPVKNRTDEGIPLLLVAFGLFILLGSSAELIWGPAGRSMDFPISGAFIWGDLIFTYNRLFILGLGILMIILLHLLIQRTSIGKAMRAISQDEDKARTLGINLSRISIITFAVGSALAGLAGGVIGSIYGLNPFMGLEPVLKAFVIVVIGGMGSVIGAIVGGYLIGVSEAIMVGYFSSEFSTIVTFAILYILLIVKPQGLFGQTEER